MTLDEDTRTIGVAATGSSSVVLAISSGKAIFILVTSLLEPATSAVGTTSPCVGAVTTVVDAKAAGAPMEGVTPTPTRTEKESAEDEGPAVRGSEGTVVTTKTGNYIAGGTSIGHVVMDATIERASLTKTIIGRSPVATKGTKVGTEGLSVVIVTATAATSPTLGTDSPVVDVGAGGTTTKIEETVDAREVGPTTTIGVSVAVGVTNVGSVGETGTTTNTNTRVCTLTRDTTTVFVAT